jgi:hypothetical protein
VQENNKAVNGANEMFPLELGNGEVLNFYTQEDKDMYLSSNNPKLRSGIRTREKELSSTVYKNRFIGYNSLTPHWSYASSYTISRNRSISFTASYSYDGVTSSITTQITNGVAVNLPADARKSSRLAARADVTVAKIQMEFYYGTTVTNRINVLRTKSVRNITNYVAYR